MREKNKINGLSQRAYIVIKKGNSKVRILSSNELFGVVDSVEISGGDSTLLKTKFI